MKNKISGIFLSLSLIFINTPLILAQVPAMETPPTEEVVVPTDTEGPSFISVATASSGQTEATVVWTTDEPTFGYIEYGQTEVYGQNTSKTDAATLEHSQMIENLSPGIVYHYRIVGEDESGNISYSQDRTIETEIEIIVADNVPPEISYISVSAVNTNSVTISWSTNELVQGKVEYGSTTDYGLETLITSDYASEHSLDLSGLLENTLYHYRIMVKDEAGNETISPDEEFTTSAVQSATSTPEEPSNPESVSTETATTTEPSDSTTPSGGSSSGSTSTTNTFEIYDVETAFIGTSTAVMTWTTNDFANSQVFYGITEDYGSASILMTNRQKSHSVKISGLIPGTKYFYKVASHDPYGHAISKSGFEFNTLNRQVINNPAPTISNVKIESIGTSTVSILWDTDMPASGELQYGKTTAYDITDGGHKNLLTNHRHILSGLESGTIYNFQAMAWNETGAESLYENLTFKTKAVVAKVGNAVENTPLITKPINNMGTNRSFRIPSSGSAYVSALDSEVQFLLDKPSSGIASGNSIIVKKLGSHPTSPTDGIFVYTGASGKFTDTGLNNDQTYFYSIFKVDVSGNYREPVKFTVVPKAGVNQTKFDKVGQVVSDTPKPDINIENYFFPFIQNALRGMMSLWK